VQLNWVIDKLLLLNWTGSTNFSFNYWCVLYVEDLTVTPSKIEKKSSIIKKRRKQSSGQRKLGEFI
jgi:hypothetical protein